MPMRSDEPLRFSGAGEEGEVCVGLGEAGAVDVDTVFAISVDLDRKITQKMINFAMKTVYT